MLAMRVGGGNAPAAGIKWDEKQGAAAVPVSTCTFDK
jgi:hypothetical protein